MSELTQILLTSSLTIIGGVLIFSITKLIEILYLGPLRKIDLLRGEISYSLTFYANRFGDPDLNDTEMTKEASSELRRLGSELRSQTYVIKNFRVLTAFSLIVPKADLIEASAELIGLSNSIYRNDINVIDERKIKIKTKLRIQD